MLSNIENVFKDLIASLQAARLYGIEHRLFKGSVGKTYLTIKEALSYKEELVFGIVGEELAYEKEIFFDLSKTIRPGIIYLKKRGIEKIIFKSGLQRDEVEKFIQFLVTPKEDIKTNPEDYLLLMGVKNILIGRLKASETRTDSQIKRSMNFLSLYESSIDKVSQTLSAVLNNESIDSLILHFTMGSIMENLIDHYQGILTLATLKRYDIGTFEHTLNVAILAMYFSSKLGFTKKDVLDIGISALFHDIGKIYISRRILRKTERLSEEEFAQITSHTFLGAELLLKYIDTLGFLPVVVAFEHHLKYNLKGYPNLSFPRKPHLASQIVSICDVYEALLERRGYKVDYTPDFVYNLMIKEKSESFDPILLERFFKFIGVWPIGSLVYLSDNRVAVVYDENEDDIFSPIVEVIEPIEKREILDLKATKGHLRIQRVLNPWTEGEKYLDVIRGHF
ncbi:MAG: HD domain-containing protein [Candidatus Omnitrophica bacterium]|nr:HD domain-containing protein [Candidatus Omnitrophota bacterium]